MIKYLIRIFFPLITKILKIYWFIFRPNTRGVRCIIKFEDKILFIKHSYNSGFWSIPGGGVKKKETFEEAIVREVKEEVGISLKNIKKIGEYTSTKEYKIDHTELFLVTVESLYFKIDNIEIAEACWSEINQVPEPHGLILEQMLNYIK